MWKSMVMFPSRFFLLKGNKTNRHFLSVMFTNVLNKQFNVVHINWNHWMDFPGHIAIKLFNLRGLCYNQKKKRR